MAYTFKDDGTKMTYYRDYNKVANDSCLVGNWVEERALKESTETFRYKLWTDPTHDPKKSDDTHSRLNGRPDVSDTAKRVVYHSYHQPTAEHHTTNQQMMQHPAQRTSELRAYVQPKQGRRAQMLHEKAMAVAEETKPAEMPPTTTFESEAMTQFTQKEWHPDNTVGRRHMMTQDMHEIAPENLDGTFYKESGMLPAHRVHEAVRTEGVPSGDYHSTPQITIYADNSHDSGAFKRSQATGYNPFGRDSEFTTAIEHYTKGSTKD